MSSKQETFVEKNVRYNVEYKGKIVTIDNLPVCINEEN